MGVYVVAYDLNRERQGWQNDRDKLLAKLKTLGGWIMLSESSYAIDTQLGVSAVTAALQPFLDANDQLYVITLTRPWDGWGPQNRNSWLIQKLGAAGG